MAQRRYFYLGGDAGSDDGDGWRWGGGCGVAVCYLHADITGEQHQRDKKGVEEKKREKQTTFSLLCLGPPPGCSDGSVTTDKQHLAVTQMFVTLCVVREAAPSVPICGGSGRRFLHVFSPIHDKSHKRHIPADFFSPTSLQSQSRGFSMI